MPCFAVVVMAGYHLPVIQHVGKFDVHSVFAYYLLYVAQGMLVVV